MSVAIKKRKFTSRQFLEWSAQQTGRYELEDGAVIELAAEKARHALMKHAATSALQAAIDRAGLRCSVFPDGMTVVVDNDNVRLPDAAIQCAPVDLDTTILDAPVVLLEVTSPSSVYRDERHKLVEYFSIPSVMHYLLLSPDDRKLVHFKRSEEPNRLDTRIMSEGQVELSPPGIIVDVQALLGVLPPNVITK
ncbi:MAG: Uma2 family endonuclease [Rhizobiaceae bacterium]